MARLPSTTPAGRAEGARTRHRGSPRLPHLSMAEIAEVLSGASGALLSAPDMTEREALTVGMPESRTPSRLARCVTRARGRRAGCALPTSHMISVHSVDRGGRRRRCSPRRRTTALAAAACFRTSGASAGRVTSSATRLSVGAVVHAAARKPGGGGAPGAEFAVPGAPSRAGRRSRRLYPPPLGRAAVGAGLTPSGASGSSAGASPGRPRAPRQRSRGRAPRR